MTAQPQIEVPPQADGDAGAALDANGPRIYGVIDAIRADRIAGWAIDRSDKAAALDIEILREGRPVQTVRADRHRADLEKGGIGTGNYGFRAEIVPPLEPGFEFTVTAVAFSPDGARGELKRVGAAVRAAEPDQRLLERIFAEVTRTAPAPVSAPVALGVEVERLSDAVTRIELIQARLEAAMESIDTPAPKAPDNGLRRLVALALLVAGVSLGVGVYSLLAG